MQATRDTYQQLLEQICGDVIAVEAEGVDETGAFPATSIAALRHTGLLGAVSAPEVGGLGLGPRGAATVVERVARECGSTAMVTAMHLCGTAVLEAHAPEPVRVAAAAGDHLSTLAFSEAGSRSHFWAPLGTARPDGDHVVLDATKSWVTSASHATAYVWSSRPLEADGLSSIWLVPTDAPGVTVHGPFDGLGLRGNDSCPVTAEGVRVPTAARLGPDGGGFEVMLGTVLPLFNILMSAASVGFMETAVVRSARHATATVHQEVGSALADLPTIRAHLARMRIDADASRALLADTLAAIEGGREDAMLRVLECKAAGGESATRVLDTAMRVGGGAAFRKEAGLERTFRDARASTVMGPTTDVLYDFIGKAVCGMDLF